HSKDNRSPARATILASESRAIASFESFSRCPMDYKAKTYRVIRRVVMPLLFSGAIMAVGSGWTVVSSPNAGTTNFLYSVAAISDVDVWAAGYDYDASSRQFTLVEHWDGSKWSIIPSPNPGTATNCGAGYSGNMLSGIADVSPSDVCAAGEMF